MVRLLQALVLALVLLQRLAVPVGGEQLSALVPAVSALVLLGTAAGTFRVDRTRLQLVTLVAGTTVLVALVQLVLGAVPSLLSVILLLVLYAPAVLSPTGDRRSYAAVGRFFVGLMAVAAALSMVQFAVQFLGGTWYDWLAELVPSNLLLADFNAGNAITYGSSINRATALVFLEPSFLSLFLGVAVVIALVEGMAWPIVTLLLLGIVPTLAGNGLVILAAAAVVWVVKGKARRLLRLVPAALVGLAVSLLTPLGGVYAGRLTEGSGSNSSTGLRFVQPYLQLIPPPLHDSVTALVGRGAGSAAAFIAGTGTDPLLATPLPKIVFEFGMVGVAGILLPLLLLLLRPLGRHPELLGLAVAYFVVNASLQTALMVYLVEVFLLWLPDLQDREAAVSGPHGSGVDLAAVDRFEPVPVPV